MRRQISRRTLRDVLSLRCKSYWLGQRRCPGGTTERVSQVIDAGGGRDLGIEDAEAGYGGEARFEECTAGECHEGERISDLQ